MFDEISSRNNVKNKKTTRKIINAITDVIKNIKDDIKDDIKDRRICNVIKNIIILIIVIIYLILFLISSIMSILMALSIIIMLISSFGYIIHDNINDNCLNQTNIVYKTICFNPNQNSIEKFFNHIPNEDDLLSACVTRNMCRERKPDRIIKISKSLPTSNFILNRLKEKNIVKCFTMIEKIN